MWPVGATMEFAQFPICTHEGREASRLRPGPFAALFPTKQKYAWPAAGLVDTILRSFRLSFELHRTEIPQCGVPPTGIVKPLNVIEHIGFRLVSCVIQRPRGTFGL